MAKLTNDPTAGELHIPDRIPLLPLQDTVVFPMMRLQLTVERDFSLAAVQQALLQERLVFVVAQREVSGDDPTVEGMYQIGTIASCSTRSLRTTGS